MLTYAHGTCFELIWNANIALVTRGSRNEHGKSAIHLGLLFTYFYNCKWNEKICFGMYTTCGRHGYSHVSIGLEVKK